MEQPTSKDAAALFDQFQSCLTQLESLACYFCQDDFETLLNALDIMSREVVFQVGHTH